MIRYLLDTSICIHVIKKQPPAVFERFDKINPGEAGISSVTLAEMEFGISKSSRPEQNRAALAHFLKPLEVLAFGEEAAECYGAIRHHLEKRGRPIGALDTLIAAHALSLEAVLVTRNVSEFRRVPELVVERW